MVSRAERLSVGAVYAVFGADQPQPEAYTLVEENAGFSGAIDVTPFLSYFIREVYDKLDNILPPAQTTGQFQSVMVSGQVTEKDYGDAVYATIRKFVKKFEELGLLDSQKYRNRVKYWIKSDGCAAGE